MDLDALKYIMDLEQERRELKAENIRLLEKWQCEVVDTVTTLLPSAPTYLDANLMRGNEVITIPSMSIEVPRGLTNKGMQEYIELVQAKVIATVCSELFNRARPLKWTDR